MRLVLQRANYQFNGAFVTINARRKNQDILLPRQETVGSAGFDLRMPNGFKLRPGESIIIQTRIAIEIPAGYFGLIKPRSSLARRGLITDAGVIDQDYRDEIMVITWNRNKYEDIEIDKGDQIAQIIILPYLPAELKESGLIIETG